MESFYKEGICTNDNEDESQGPPIILVSCHQLPNVFIDVYFASLGTSYQ